MTNIIDIKKLPVREGKTNDTYLTLSQEGDLTRTTIVIPEGGGGSVDNGAYILKDTRDIYYDKKRYASNGSVLEVIEEGTEIYIGSERQKHNLEIIRAIEEGKCSSVFYEYLESNSKQTDLENGEYIRGMYYNKLYYPVSFTYTPDSDFLLANNTINENEYIGFSYVNLRDYIRGFYSSDNIISLTNLYLSREDAREIHRTSTKMIDVPVEVKYVTSTKLANGKYRLSISDFRNLLNTSSNARENIVALYLNDTRENDRNRIIMANVIKNGASTNEIVVYGNFDENNIIKWDFGGNTYAEGTIIPISNGNTLNGDASTVVTNAIPQLMREPVENAYKGHKGLFAYVMETDTINYPSTQKIIPLIIEAHYNSDAQITGYTVWGWINKTQTITWTFTGDITSTFGVIE